MKYLYHLYMNNLIGSPCPLKVGTRPVFEMDSVSVGLEWMPEGVSYNVTADQVG